ncbi:MAG: 23S rRNA (adenine(2503)-C(2))-methyltransferase RlmN [Holosporaceae bacterium]|nr:23S rRNA (adenine(2503)-C(2))-methyltransferase RlmN [Holosporaceae bacterium]
MIRHSLLGLTASQLQECFLENGLSRLDAKRVFPWIQIKSLLSFDAMTDIPKKTRIILQKKFSVDLPSCTALQESVDGTRKALLEFDNDNFIDDNVTESERKFYCNSIETVFIPDENRNTVCISTQIGCAMGCKFCNTGSQSFTRNLTASEIMAQIFFWKKNIEAFVSKKNQMIPSKNHRSISNVVFMGMGEPLLNYEQVSYALQLLLDTKAHNFSRHKITVSTCGIANKYLDNLADFGVKLAISLHAADDITRSSIMPINSSYNIDCLLKAAERYLERSNTDHITFEYLLLSGINDNEHAALQLSKLLNRARVWCRVNLIVFNSWPGCDFVSSCRDSADNFSRILLSRGIRTIIRKSRGSDILAACGQLKIQ